MNYLKHNRFFLVCNLIAAILSICIGILFAMINPSILAVFLVVILCGSLGFFSTGLGRTLDHYFPPKLVAPFPPKEEVWRQ